MEKQYNEKDITSLFENKPSVFQISEKEIKKAKKKEVDAFKEKKEELTKPYVESFEDEGEEVEEEISPSREVDITEEIEQLIEMREQMIEMLHEADGIIRQAANQVGSRLIHERARSYWIGHLNQALSNESEYLGKSMYTFEDTIQELEAAANGESDEYDDEEHDV